MEEENVAAPGVESVEGGSETLIAALESRNAQVSKQTKIIIGSCLGAVVCAFLIALAVSGRKKLPVATYLTVKPRGDTRSYQFAELHNGIRVVNVYDETSKQRAFAVAVKVGSFNDPVEVPGLAHFCEHMLFTGSQKYPEGEFDDFFGRHGGVKNAFTNYETTVFFGEMTDGADGAEGQDRFADAFRAPSFKLDNLEGGVKSIEEEHAKNMEDPNWRTLQFFYSLADPHSVLNRFHTGNKHTLFEKPEADGVDISRSVKAFFNSHYCPDRMQLVTFSSEPLETQLKTVNNQFGDIKSPDSSCSTPVSDTQSYMKDTPFLPENMGKFARVLGTQSDPELWLHFHLPDTQKEYMSQPLQYLFWVLEYDGEDSLARVVEDHVGLATGISVFNDQSSLGTELFLVVSLTQNGALYPGLVMDFVYTYLSALRRAGVSKKLYRSLARIAQLEWDWGERTGPSATAQTIAEQMTRLPVSDLLSGDALIASPNASVVSRLLEAMEPRNMNVAFVAPKSTNGSKVFGKSEVHDLPNFGVKHTVMDLEEVFPGRAERWTGWLDLLVTEEEMKDELDTELKKCDEIKTIDGDIMPVAPGAIVDVPGELSLEFMEADPVTDEDDVDMFLYGTRPQQLEMTLTLRESIAIFAHSKSDGSKTLPIAVHEVYYRKGWVTTSPKVSFQIFLRPMRRDEDEPLGPMDSLRLTLYNQMLATEMKPRMIDFTAAGATYSIEANTEGLTFTLTGFLPTLQAVAENLLAEFNDYNKRRVETTDSRFKNERDVVKNALETTTEMPYTYALADRDLLLTQRQFHREELLDVIMDTSKKSVASAAIDLIMNRPLHLTSLVMGNIDAEEARMGVTQFVGGMEASDKVDEDMHLDSKVERVTPIVKFGYPVELRMKSPRPNDDNYVTVVTLIAGVASVETRVELGIIGQLLQTVAFNELRTRMELGYVISAGVGMLSNVQYVSCIVQGDVLDPDRTEAAIENMFSTNMTAFLRNMTDEDFEALKDSYRQTLLEPPLTYMDEASHFFSPMSLGSDCLALRSEMLKYLDYFKKKTRLVRTWTAITQPKKHLRNRIVVKYFPGDVPKKPKLLEASALWESAGVGSSHAVLLASELMNTSTHEVVNSTLRSMLAEDGGFYPTDVHCNMTAPKSLLQTDVKVRVQGQAESGVPEVALKSDSMAHQEVLEVGAASEAPLKRRGSVPFFLGSD